MKVSRAQKVGVALRIASQHAKKSRWLTAIWRGAKVTAASFSHVLGILWLEVTGFVFLSLSAIGGFAFAREYAKYEAGKTTVGRVILAIAFTLTFAWFGLSSFWRARRKL
jgi:hypothetical protein